MAIHYVALMLGCRSEPEGARTSPASPPPPEAVAGDAVRGLVGEALVLDGSASTGTAFTWTTSDGRVTEGAIVELAFEAPGHYTGVLEVTDDRGRSDTDSLSISVRWPVAVPGPQTSASVTADGDVVYAVLPDFDQVVAVDRASRAVLRWIPTCDQPRSVAVGSGALWVACAGDAVARITDGDDRRIAFPPGSQPFAVLPVGEAVLVTLQGTGSLVRLNGDGDIEATIAVAPDIRGLASIGDTVLVTRYRSPDDQGLLFRTDPSFTALDVTSLQVDPGPDSDTNSRGVPNLLERVVVRPDGRVAVVSGSKANVERGLFRDGLPLTFETTCRADLRQVSLQADEGPVGEELEPAVFDDRDQAVATAYSPEGDWLYVLHRGMETVDILDGWSLELAGAIQDVGSGADGLWTDGNELWVLASSSRRMSVYDVSAVAAPLGTVDLLPPEGEVLDAEVLRGRILFGRSVDPRMTTGGYLSCASCHPEGDHDGRTWDFTDRGEGLRNTISLLGHGGRAPIHWTANFDEVQDFENDVRGPMAGDGFLTDEGFAATSDTLGAPKAGLSEDLDALAAYVESLTAFPASPFPPHPERGLPGPSPEGEAVFTAAGCPECHPPPLYEDSAFLGVGDPVLHDVGTITAASGQRLGAPLTGLDTPTLRGSWSTAPYLHDGSAATLREVLVDRNPEDQHGAVSGLTEGEIEALTAFLQSL